MIGAIIGDIVGSRFEWDNHRSKDFDFLTHKCFFTDDSVMSLAVCDALLHAKPDYSDLNKMAVESMQRIGRPYPHCGYGGSFYHWMYSDIQNDALFDFAVGKSAGSLSPRVKWEHLKNFEFELPDMDKQKELAALLWAMDDTKKSYQKLIAATDELVKSQFIEWFGTADRHPKDVEYVRLGDLATYINGFAFKPDDWGEHGLPIIRIQNLTGTNEVFNYYDGEYPKQVEVNDGDVLISWSASLGVYLWRQGRAILNQHIFKVVFDKKPIDKDFFMCAVAQKLEEMGTKTHGATMKHIVKKDFDNTVIAYPEQAVQQQFAAFVRQSDKSKFELEQALAELTATYKRIIAENLG